MFFMKMWMLSVSRFIGVPVSWFYSCTPCILFLVDALFFDVCVGRPPDACLWEALYTDGLWDALYSDVLWDALYADAL